jgi:hypothetical protein
MKYLIAFFSVITILVIPSVVWAQCASLPLGAQRTICQIVADLGTLLFYTGIALAVVIVIWSGIKYMTAGSDEQKVGSAKKTLLYGLIGAAIVFASYFIVQLLQDLLEHYGV